MKRFVHPLIALLAIIILSGGCGSSGPSLPPPYDEGAMSNETFNFDGIGFDSSGLWANIPSGNDVRTLPRWLNDEVLIVLHDGEDASALYPMAKKIGLTLMREIHLMWGTVYRMHIDSGESVEAVVNELLSRPEVRYAEPNLIMYPCAAPYYPNDPLFEYSGDPDDDPWNNMLDQWGPNVLGASLVWPSGKGHPDVVIAVLDTGYRYTHEDLANQVWINEDEIPDNDIDDDDNGYIDDWRGWDTDDGDNDVWDTYGHGTACSGVVAAEQDNGVGCTGIAPGVKVMPIRCDLSGGGGYTTSVIEGVQYAYDNGATAVSMSFRTYTESEIMHNTFIATYDGGNGLLPVGAAGNEDWANDCWPADWPEVFEVGATCSFYLTGERRDVRRLDMVDFHSWGSNWGPNLEIMAPGALYISTHYGNDSSYYDGGSNGFFGGTSNAAPCVAGSVGLLKSYFPEMTAAELRQRLKETADDLHTPGHDNQTGYGRVNIWRAIFGSEPNEDIYDTNGHIPIDSPDTWMYDSIFDISTSADYDYEDIFVVQADENGVFSVELEPITTGENLDIEIYPTPDLETPIGSGYGINNENNPFEFVYVTAQPGLKYYIRVFSPAPYNCSNFRLRYKVEEFYWHLDWESIAPIYVFNQSSGVPLLKLDFTTNLLININEMRVYISGDIPHDLVNNIRVYEDTNSSGAWEESGDTQFGAANTVDFGVNQLIITDDLGEFTYNAPLTLFIVADIGPNELGYNVNFGVGLHSYKDITIEQDVKLVDDTFPVLSDLIVFGEDHDPPVWDTTIGIQYVFGGYQSATLYWNNATDLLSEPTGYNVYMDENDPPDIATAQVTKDIGYMNGGEYDHFVNIPELENDKTYFFLVRAEDASGNEDENLIWLEGTPSGTSDPENPQTVGQLSLAGNAQEVWAHDKIAYVACENGGLAIVDCSIPTTPSLIDTYSCYTCRAVQYYAPQDYVYAIAGTGLIIIDPDAPSGPELVGSYGVSWGREVYVDNDICCIGAWGAFVILDVSNPAVPELKSEFDLGWSQTVYGLEMRDGYAYLATYSDGLMILDVSDPVNPVEVKQLSLSGYMYEIDLWGNYAFVSSNWNHTLHIVDITDPPNAFSAGVMIIPGITIYGRGVAVRDMQYVYVGIYPSYLYSIRWDDLDNVHTAGSLETDGPDGLFYDGEFLYSAENEHGLKVIL